MTSSYFTLPDPSAMNCTENQEVTCLTICLCIEKTKSSVEAGIIVPVILAGILCIGVLVYAKCKYKIGSYSPQWVGDKSTEDEESGRINYYEENYELESMDGDERVSDVGDVVEKKEVVNRNNDLPGYTEEKEDKEKVTVHREDSKSSQNEYSEPDEPPPDVRWDEELKNAVEIEESKEKAEKFSESDNDHDNDQSVTENEEQQN